MSRAALQSGPALQRFAAKILDELIIIACLFICAKLLQAPAIVVLLSFLIPLCYHAYLHASILQATYGEQIMKLHVVTDDGARLSLRKSLERSLAYALPSLPAYSSLDQESIVPLLMFLVFVWFIPILFSKHAKGLHDILCGTRVVAGKLG